MSPSTLWSSRSSNSTTEMNARPPRDPAGRVRAGVLRPESTSRGERRPDARRVRPPRGESDPTSPEKTSKEGIP